MGNTLAEINKKIQRDKKSQVQKTWMDDIQSQSEESVDKKQKQTSFFDRFRRQKTHSADGDSQDGYSRELGRETAMREMDKSMMSYSESFRKSRYNEATFGDMYSIYSPSFLSQSSLKYEWKPLKDLLSGKDKNYEKSSNLQRLRDRLNQEVDLSALIQKRQVFYSKVLRSLTNLNKEISQQKILLVQRIQVDLNAYWQLSRSRINQEVIKQLKQNKKQPNININQKQVQQLIKQKRQHQKQVNDTIYKWRTFLATESLNSPPNQFPIVHIYEFSSPPLNISPSLGFRIIKQKVTLYQQFIPYKLYSVRHLTHLQGLYVLEQALLGFMMLYQVFGFFIVQQQMIGFNTDGVLKVWMSPEYWSNLFSSGFTANNLNNPNINIPRSASLSIQDQLDRSDMVTSIWMIVQRYSLFHQSLIIDSNGFRCCNFRKALEIIARHKCKIIDNRTVDLVGMVKFVTKLNFQSERKSQAPREFHNINLLINPISQVSVQQPETPSQNINYNTKSIIRSLISKPQMETSTSLKSHIEIIKKNKNQSNKKRPVIFNKGYENSMENNQTNSSLSLSINKHSQLQAERSHMIPEEDQPEERKHVTFVTIKSQRT